VDEADLSEALRRGQVLAVTQLPAAQGLLWPSKLALLLGLPRPILWVGPIEGAIGRRLRAVPNAGVFAPGQAAEVADWLLAVQSRDNASVPPAIDAAEHREGALAAWVRLLEQPRRGSP
jgi:hypothetical protein